jgi:hypothetical protein
MTGASNDTVKAALTVQFLPIRGNPFLKGTPHIGQMEYDQAIGDKADHRKTQPRPGPSLSDGPFSAALAAMTAMPPAAH